MTTLAELDIWLAQGESEHLEFKEAKQNFHFEELARYCCALANEGGGAVVLGVTDRPPRQVVGSVAFLDVEGLKASLFNRLSLRCAAEELTHPAGRVLIVQVPSRPLGVPIGIHGSFWMRAGATLVPMSAERMQRIFAELVPDYSATIPAGASFDDLAPAAITIFRQRWREKSGNDRLDRLDDHHLLADAGLASDDRPTVAALVLCGKDASLSRLLGMAEITHEWRSNPHSTPYQGRRDWRTAFLLCYDEIWKAIDLRNDIHQYQDGLIRHDVRTFNERTVREALLNAVCHRDYQHQSSIVLRQSPHELVMTSPGGFPSGITADNLLTHQRPRNRLLAEAFARCGLVERSGQGADLMFELCLREAKRLPDFTGSDDYQVKLSIDGTVGDTGFIRFLDHAERGTGLHFDLPELRLLTDLYANREPEGTPADAAERLLESDVVRVTPRGRFHLSSRFDERSGTAIATGGRPKDAERTARKDLLVQYLRNQGKVGASFADLCAAVPGATAAQVQHLLRELKEAGLIDHTGATKASRWFAV